MKEQIRLGDRGDPYNLHIFKAGKFPNRKCVNFLCGAYTQKYSSGVYL